MTELQQVIKEAQSALDKGFVFVHVKAPWLTTLLDGLEEAQKEIKRLSTCPECGGSEINVMCDDPYYAERCSCTVDWMGEACKLADENRVMRTEHTTMKMELEWINEYRESLPTSIETYQLADAFLMAMDKASYALSTLSNKEDTTCTDSTSTEQES